MNKKYSNIAMVICIILLGIGSLFFVFSQNIQSYSNENDLKIGTLTINHPEDISRNFCNTYRG